MYLHTLKFWLAEWNILLPKMQMKVPLCSSKLVFAFEEDLPDLTSGQQRRPQQWTKVFHHRPRLPARLDTTLFTFVGLPVVFHTCACSWTSIVICWLYWCDSWWWSTWIAWLALQDTLEVLLVNDLVTPFQIELTLLYSGQWTYLMQSDMIWDHDDNDDHDIHDNHDGNIWHEDYDDKWILQGDFFNWPTP